MYNNPHKGQVSLTKKEKRSPSIIDTYTSTGLNNKSIWKIGKWLIFWWNLPLK